MGTRSMIGITNPDGTVDAIYCHWDGYYSNNGRILQEHYTTEEKVRALMALGSISSLRPEIGEKHPFDRPSIMDREAYATYMERYGDMVTAHHRDRGDDLVPAHRYHIVNQMIGDMGTEYAYLFRNGEWYGACANDMRPSWRMLVQCLGDEAEEE